MPARKSASTRKRRVTHDKPTTETIASSGGVGDLGPQRSGRAASDVQAEMSDRAMPAASRRSRRSASAGERDAKRTRPLPDVVGAMAPELGGVALAAVGVALLEMELLPAVLLGAAAMLVPRMIPAAGTIVRPMVKGVVKLGYGAVTMAQEAVAEASEQMQDIMAEVRSESGRAGGSRAARAGARAAAA